MKYSTRNKLVWIINGFVTCVLAFLVMRFVKQSLTGFWIGAYVGVGIMFHFLSNEARFYKWVQREPAAPTPNPEEAPK